MTEDPAATPGNYPPPALGTPVPESVRVSSEAAIVVAQPKRRRLRWLWWTAGSLVVTSLAGVCAYLIVVSNQWSDRVDELTAVSHDLGAQVSEQTAARQQSEAKVASLQSQLDTATARITVLANEEANATDHETVWINLVDSFIDCANGRQDLIEVLNNSRLYFPGRTNRQVENDLIAYCDGLTSDYADFKTEIGK